MPPHIHTLILTYFITDTGFGADFWIVVVRAQNHRDRHSYRCGKQLERRADGLKLNHALTGEGWPRDLGLHAALLADQHEKDTVMEGTAF